MNLRRMSLALIILTAMSGCVVTTPSRAEVRVVAVRVAPPPPRVIVVPAPRRGYAWAPGYWRWNGRRHVWIDGRWVRERRGYVWVADGWSHRGGDWHYVPGHWVKGR